MGVLQSQVLSQVSGPRSFPRGYPNPGQRVPQDRVPSDQARTGVPPTWDWGTPSQDRTETEQRSEYLLRGGRYASCGHAGALCFLNIFHAGRNELQVQNLISCKFTFF